MEDQPVPDVSSVAPAVVRKFVVIDVHKNSLVAGVLPPSGGMPEVERVENTEKAVRRLIARLGGPGGLAVAYEAGPGGFALYRLLTGVGVGGGIIPPALGSRPRRGPGKTRQRDAQKAGGVYRPRGVVFVRAPSNRQEGAR